MREGGREGDLGCHWVIVGTFVTVTGSSSVSLYNLSYTERLLGNLVSTGWLIRRVECDTPQSGETGGSVTYNLRKTRFSI